MKIVLAGGSGQIGTILFHALSKLGHDICVLSRKEQHNGRTVLWDAKTVGAWAKELDGADVLINLAGRTVNCRYTDAHRHEILASRVDSTRALANAIASVHSPPKIWLQSSTATIYAHRYDQANDDVDGLLGGSEQSAPDTWNFSIEVARAWEAAATQTIDLPATRVVLMRTAMVMSPDRGGVFDVLLRLVRFGLGGAAGNGKQYVSWIHSTDFVNAVLWTVEHPELSGPVNFASPNPLPNREFMTGLRNAWGIGIGLPAATWMVEAGALAMRTESELVLKSRRVTPKRLLDSGFQFTYSAWPAAARALCADWLN